jgi:hypothetical protein
VWLVAAAGVGVLIWKNPAGRKAPAVTTVDAGAVVTPDAAAAPDAAIAGDAAVVLEREVDAAPVAPPMYTVTEAFDDIAAGPLVFVGRGEWFGNASIKACAYRNARVIVVNEYCTATETPALGLVVISPTRGRLKIYAEAESAISTLQRSDYITFRAEVEEPATDEPAALAFTYAELRAWDERRYNAHHGACWYANAEESCSMGHSGQLAAWSESAKAFIDDPPEAWYRLAKDLHARALRDSQR